MTNLNTPIRYKNLDCCGHLVFTGAPLVHALEVTGWPEVELWVESCDQDADIFCYLESYDPHTGSVACVSVVLVKQPSWVVCMLTGAKAQAVHLHRC